MTKKIDREAAAKALNEASLWLGRAMSAFSKVEEAIGLAYRACFSFDDQPVAMHAFFAVTDTKTRRDMTARAVFYSLNFLGNPTDLVERWRGVITEAKRLSELRNKLAHGRLQYTKSLRDSSYRLYVLPFAHTEPYADVASEHLKGNGASPKGTWAAQNKKIALEEIQTFTLDCESLRKSLRALSHELEAALEKARSDLMDDPNQPDR